MTILDRARGTRRMRIDPRQLADELAKRLPDLDQVDLGKARENAEDALSDATRGLRSDLEKAGDTFADNNPFDDLAQRLRSFASNGGLPGLVSRLERELPDTDKDRYMRAFERGRVQTRTRYLVVGTVAGVSAGALAFVFLDPARGKARRDAIAKRLSTATDGLTRKVRETTQAAQDRAREIAAERGMVEPGREPVAVMDPPQGSSWPAAASPMDLPLDEPNLGAHEALPEDLVGVGHTNDTGDPAESTPLA